MERIAKILIEYGMDFHYENNGSQGEKITSFELGIMIYSSQGKLFFDHDGNMEELEDLSLE